MDRDMQIFKREVPSDLIQEIENLEIALRQNGVINFHNYFPRVENLGQRAESFRLTPETECRLKRLHTAAVEAMAQNMVIIEGFPPAMRPIVAFAIKAFRERFNDATHLPGSFFHDLKTTQSKWDRIEEGDLQSPIYYTLDYNLEAMRLGEPPDRFMDDQQFDDTYGYGEDNWHPEHGLKSLDDEKE